MSVSTAGKWDQSIWGENLFAIPPEEISFTYRLNAHINSGNSEGILKNRYLFWQLFCLANNTHNSTFSSSLLEKIGHPTGDNVIIQKMNDTCLKLQELFTKVFNGESGSIIVLSLYNQIYFCSDEEVLDCTLDMKNKLSISGSLYKSHVKTIFQRMIGFLRYEVDEDKVKRLVKFKTKKNPREMHVFRYAFPVKATSVTAPLTITSLPSGMSP